MPSKRVVPKKLRVPEWYVSSFMMDRALEAVVRQVKKLDRRHDIPYLAGYSKNGKTIYIDRHMPKSFLFRGRRINIDRFLILHEAMEKTLMDHLGLRYLHAHQIATRAEQAAVRASGVSWNAYDRLMRTYVKRIGDARVIKIPAILTSSPTRMNTTTSFCAEWPQRSTKGRCPWVFVPIVCVIAAGSQRRNHDKVARWWMKLERFPPA